MMKVEQKKTDQYKQIEISSQEFAAHHRNQFWYIGIGLLVAGAVYLAVYFNDYLSAAVAVAAGIAIFRVANLQSNARKVMITDNGLYWGDSFFGYHQLRAFWLDVVEGKTTIFVQRLNLNAPIVFNATNAETEIVTKKLLNHLPFHEHKREPFADKFSRFFKL